MSSGQYALRLDEEYNRLKAYSCTLKQEVRELTKELNTPVLRKVFDEDTAIEKMER